MQVRSYSAHPVIIEIPLAIRRQVPDPETAPVSIHNCNRAGDIDHEFAAGLNRPSEGLADDASGLSAALRHRVFHDHARSLGFDVRRHKSHAVHYDDVNNSPVRRGPLLQLWKDYAAEISCSPVPVFDPVI